jgi:hypothetical protein
MPNRTEARPVKAALTNATGRLPLLRLFSTPLIDQRSKRVIAWLRQLSSHPNADHLKFFMKLMKTRRLAVISAALLSALLCGAQTQANSSQTEKFPSPDGPRVPIRSAARGAKKWRPGGDGR